MAPIIRDEKLTKISGNVRPDAKRRVVLPIALVREDISYHIYANKLGQIVLDPQVTIPATEAWLFNNPDVLALVQSGLSDATKGKVSKINLKTL